MAVRVLTASPAERLVSLAALKAELGITDSASDAKLLRVSNAVARAFAGELGRPLPRQRYEESLPGSGRRRLLLSRRPVDPDSVAVVLNDTALDVALDEFSIEDAREGLLFSGTGWPACFAAPGEDAEPNVVVTYSAGWVLPEFLSEWAASSSSIASSTSKWVRPTSPTLSPLLFEVTVAGNTGGTEPTWPTTAGTEVTDGAATLVGRDVAELPADLYEVALITAQQWFEGALDVRAGVQSESAEGFAIAYDFVGARDAQNQLPPFARHVIASYR